MPIEFQVNLISMCYVKEKEEEGGEKIVAFNLKTECIHRVNSLVQS